MTRMHLRRNDELEGITGPVGGKQVLSDKQLIAHSYLTNAVVQDDTSVEFHSGKVEPVAYVETMAERLEREAREQGASKGGKVAVKDRVSAKVIATELRDNQRLADKLRANTNRKAVKKAEAALALQNNTRRNVEWMARRKVTY